MDDFLEQTAVRQKPGVYTLLYYLAWLMMIVCALMAAMSLANVAGVNPETGRLAFSLPALFMALVFGALAFVLFRAKDECRV